MRCVPAYPHYSLELRSSGWGQCTCIRIAANNAAAPQDRSRNRGRLQAPHRRRRQDPRPLYVILSPAPALSPLPRTLPTTPTLLTHPLRPRHPRVRRLRIRRLVRTRPAPQLQGRQWPGHQGLGPGSSGHVPGREEEADDPARLGVRKQGRWANPC